MQWTHVHLSLCVCVCECVCSSVSASAPDSISSWMGNVWHSLTVNFFVSFYLVFDVWRVWVHREKLSIYWSYSYAFDTHIVFLMNCRDVLRRNHCRGWRCRRINAIVTNLWLSRQIYDAQWMDSMNVRWRCQVHFAGFRYSASMRRVERPYRPVYW